MKGEWANVSNRGQIRRRRHGHDAAGSGTRKGLASSCSNLPSWRIQASAIDLASRKLLLVWIMTEHTNEVGKDTESVGDPGEVRAILIGNLIGNFAKLSICGTDH